MQSVRHSMHSGRSCLMQSVRHSMHSRRSCCCSAVHTLRHVRGGAKHGACSAITTKPRFRYLLALHFGQLFVLISPMFDSLSGIRKAAHVSQVASAAPHSSNPPHCLLQPHLHAFPIRFDGVTLRRPVASYTQACGGQACGGWEARHRASELLRDESGNPKGILQGFVDRQGAQASPWLQGTREQEQGGQLLPAGK